MPIYEYQCQSCGHEHEALQKLGAEPLTYLPGLHEAGINEKNLCCRIQIKRQRLV